MKNKKLLYILIPGTLLLWGVIIYRLFSTVGPDASNKQVQGETIASTENKRIVADTFSIVANYRDPFLGTFQHSTNKSTKPTKPQQPKITAPIKAEKPFPKIVYSGLIKNNQSNKQLILIQINGQSSSMQIGDTFNQVELSRVFRDSIEVVYEKEKRFIYKK